MNLASIKKSHTLLPVLSLLMILTFASCGSSKNNIAITESETLTVSGSLPLKDRFGILVTEDKQWEDVTVNMNLSVLSPGKMKIAGRAVIVRDKSIDLSLRVFGMEMARVYVTDDSVFAFVRPNKIYMQESLKELMSAYGFSLANIQDLLMGNIFLPGHIGLSPGDYKLFSLESFDAGWTAIPLKQPKGVDYGFMINRENRLMKVAGSAGKGQFECDYTPGEPFADDMTMTIALPKNIISAMIQWKWGSARWNQGNTREWSVPSGYKRIRPDSLMKMAMVN